MDSSTRDSVAESRSPAPLSYTDTHTHTHTHLYMYRVSNVEASTNVSTGEVELAR